MPDAAVLAQARVRPEKERMRGRGEGPGAAVGGQPISPGRERRVARGVSVCCSVLLALASGRMDSEQPAPWL